MKKIILLAMSLIVVLFTGCAKYEYANGVQIPQPEVLKEHRQYKVYLDDSAIKQRELDVMTAYKNTLAKGVVINQHLTSKHRLKENYAFENISGHNFVSNEKGNIRYLQKDFSFSDMNTILANTNTTMKAHTVVLNFKIDGRRLVSEKYDDETKMFIDLVYLALFNKSEKFEKIVSEYGFSDFVIDGNELRNNKRIALIPVTKEFDIKTKLDIQLATKGYTIVQNKKEANQVIGLDIVAFARGYQLKDIKGKSYSSSSFDSAVSMGSDISSMGSTEIGVGLVLLDALFSPDTKNSIYCVLKISKIHKGTEKVSQLYPEPITNYNLFDSIYSGKYRKIKKKNYDYMFSLYTQKVSDFIESGSTGHSNDTTIKW